MSYRVYGYVRRSDNNQPLQGLLVKAYDVDWITSDDFLGQVFTSTTGYFEIKFSRSAFDAGWYDPEGGPDIKLKIYNDGRLIYVSEKRSGAGENTYFNIYINPLDLLGEYTVDGTVWDSRSNRVLCNLKIDAYDDDFIFDDCVGHAKTNHEGKYLIPFTHDNFSGIFEGKPDMYVKVLNNAGRKLAQSNTRDESPRHSRINVWIPAQEISMSISECIYGWTAKYRQEGTHIIVRIRLNPDSNVTDAEVTTLRNTWKTGIENKWGNRFVCKCTSAGCSNQGTLTFEVQWVNSNAHHTVRIRRGPERSNMTCWDTNDTGDVASHEFGHMIGLVDEYSDAACPSRSPVNTGTVMDDNTEVVERHVEHLCRLLNEDATPIAAAPEKYGAKYAEATRKVFEMNDKEKYKMCRMPDLEARTKIKASVKSLIKDKAALGKDDRIIHIITGGIEGKRLFQKTEITGKGKVTYYKKDQMLNIEEQYSSAIEERNLINLLQSIISSNLLDLKDAGGPFIPDSIIGIITLEIGGNSTSFYYLADPGQRRDQDIVLKPPVFAFDDNLKRLNDRINKRDDTRQKKINDIMKKKKNEK